MEQCRYCPYRKECHNQECIADRENEYKRYQDGIK